MMKNILTETLTIIIVTTILHLLLPYLPWWTTVVVAATVGFLMHLNTRNNIIAGLLSGVLLWGSWILFLLQKGGSGVSEKIATLFQVPTVGLVFITILIGTILSILGTMFGGFTRNLISKN